ncbi:lactate dehydrogenase [Solibacillus sp. A46]|uniref:Lactate dehydrogenase n=1 Tax=Solibacillus faecavium TaxID=2762221 RepID=A0ABR8XZ74_9BACL|nr:lactate dehydrogenase [Solibacillus faecavium]MBD8037208.1 lactate dehydrogenase [Solibacillus faecavium]
MDVLLEQIRKDLDYLNSQGKHVKKIKMNSKVFERMTNKLTDVEVNNDAVTVFGIIIEADDNTEKFAFILDEATRT